MKYGYPQSFKHWASTGPSGPASSSTLASMLVLGRLAVVPPVRLVPPVPPPPLAVVPPVRLVPPVPPARPELPALLVDAPPVVALAPAVPALLDDGSAALDPPLLNGMLELPPDPPVPGVAPSERLSVALFVQPEASSNAATIRNR